MKKSLFLFFLCITLYNIYGQSLSKNLIIYESNNKVILNDGMTYEIVAETRFKDNPDKFIQQEKDINGHVLLLNRIIVVKNDKKSIKLVEWANDYVKFYEDPELLDITSPETKYSSSH